MDILQLIKKRRSIRKFQDKKLPPELMDELQEALIWAPSAGNLQTRKFFFVKSEELKQRLVRAAWGQSFIAEAPVAVVACVDVRIGGHYGDRGITLYGPQDVAASVQNLLLLACDRGLATVWIGAFDEEAVSKVMNLPRHLRPVAIVPVGYGAETPQPPPRVPKSKAIEFIE